MLEPAVCGAVAFSVEGTFQRTKEGDIMVLDTVGCMWRYRDYDGAISFAEFMALWLL
jgi:hypothetical protein